MEESGGSKLSRKIRENPSVPIGMAGFVAACGIGAYKYKHRGNMSTSLYLVQLRVIAQGMVVGSLCIGIMVSLGQRLLKSSSSKEQ